MEVSEEVLQLENDGMASAESNTDDTDDDVEIVEAFVGNDGEVYELRRAHQKKNNKKGAGFSAVKNSRDTWNWNNKGGPNVPTVNAVQPFDNRFLRCGQEGHQWRQCHLPFQKVSAFSTRPSTGIAQKGSPEKRKGVDRVAFTVGENGAERPAVEDVNTVQAEGNHDVEEKMTESEWVARWNSEAVDCVLMCEEILLAVTRPDVMRIILDSGTTSTVIGRRWLQEYVKNKLKPPILKSSRSFKFGDSPRHCRMGLVKLEFEVDSKSGKEGDVRLICMVEADIVNCDVPLLISRTALTRVAGILNFGDNSLLVNGKYLIGLKQYGNGHLGFQVATHERTEQQKREPLTMYSAEEVLPVVSEEEGAKECVAAKQEIFDMIQCVGNLCDGKDPPVIQEKLEDAMVRGFQETKKFFGRGQ